MKILNFFLFFVFQGDCDNVTKLEKADILELTVRHLHNLRRQNKLYATANVAYADRFRAGFTHCAAEVSQFLNKIDQNANAHLMRHLRDCIQRCEPAPPPPPPPVLRMASPGPAAVPTDHFYPPALPIPVHAVAKANQKVVALDGNGNNANYLSSYPVDHPDNRPVLVKRSGSPSGCSSSGSSIASDDGKDEDPQQGDVWRPW